MKKVPRGKPFLPGNNMNPRGARAHNPVKKEFKKLTEEQLKEIMELILKTNPFELPDIVKNSDTVLKAWIGQAALMGMNNGDLGPLLSIIDRVLGRIKERVEISRPACDMTVEEIDAEILRLKQINDRT